MYIYVVIYIYIVYIYIVYIHIYIKYTDISKLYPHIYNIHTYIKYTYNVHLHKYSIVSYVKLYLWLNVFECACRVDISKQLLHQLMVSVGAGSNFLTHIENM